MKRYFEIDFFKGLAVIAMVIFHYFYFGTEMGKLNYNTSDGFLYFLAKFAHLTFIFMVGINLVITRINYKNKTDKEYREGQYKRILFIMSLALFISFASYVVMPDKWVKFGILHFMAVGIFVMLPFVNKPNISLIIAVVIALIFQINQAGYLTELHRYIPEKLAFILGLYNYKYNAVDHFSIFKYLPVMAAGIYTGHQIYEPGTRKIKALNDLDNKLTKDNVIVKIGKSSLGIYIAHLVLMYIYFINI